MSITLNPQLRAIHSMKETSKSTVNMDPKGRFVQMYNTFLVVTGVTVHSTIPVKNPKDPKRNGMTESWNTRAPTSNRFSQSLL